MRFTAAIACCLVAWDCLEKGAGLAPQELFIAYQVWLWTVAGGLWVLNAVLIFLDGGS